jgi:hypothetical protein
MNGDGRTPGFGRDLRQIRMVVELLALSGQEAVADLAPLLHPEMRVLAAPGVAPVRSYQTREEFIAYFADAKEHGVLIEPDASEVRLSPTGAVFVAGALRMSGPNGIDEIPAWFVYTFRDGLIASLENHLDREMAQHAAGLIPGAAG